MHIKYKLSNIGKAGILSPVLIPDPKQCILVPTKLGNLGKAGILSPDILNINNSYYVQTR